MNSTPQGQIDDATLSAWLDRALDTDDMIAVTSALEQQPELQQRLTAMLCNDRMLQQHYSRMAQQPVPAALQTLLQADSSDQLETECATEPVADNNQSSWHERLFSLLGDLLPRPVLAALAVLGALGLGLMLGQQSAPTDPPGSMQPTLLMTTLQPGHPVHKLLESIPAGDYRQLDQHTDAVVDLTFQHSNGDFCRQFRVYDLASARGNIAIACRQQSGWQLRLAQASNAPLHAGDQYQAASGPDTTLIDRFIMDHIRGDVLLGAAEQQLMKGDWSGMDS